VKENRFFNEYIKLMNKEIANLKEEKETFLKVAKKHKSNGKGSQAKKGEEYAEETQFLITEFIMLRTKMIALHKTL